MTNQEINEAVARKLGGERRTLPDAILMDGTVIKHYPDYAGSIEAAWEIVEHLKTDYRTGPIVSLGLRFDSIRHWVFGFCDYRDSSIKPVEYEASAPTAPLAICLAFLRLPDSL